MFQCFVGLARVGVVIEARLVEKLGQLIDELNAIVGPVERQDGGFDALQNGIAIVFLLSQNCQNQGPGGSSGKFTS